MLGGRSGIRTLDLRGNRIGKLGIRAIAEALERSERVRHVYVHAGGKVEALGANRWADPRLQSTTSQSQNANSNATGNDSAAAGSGGNDLAVMVTVETVCVVDCRENNPTAVPGLLTDGDLTVNSAQQSSSPAMLAAITQGTAANISPNENRETGDDSQHRQFKLGSKSKKSSKSTSGKDDVIFFFFRNVPSK